MKCHEYNKGYVNITDLGANLFSIFCLKILKVIVRDQVRGILILWHAGWTQTNRFVMNLWHQRRIFHKRAPSVCLWRTLSCYHSRRKHMFGLQNVCQISLVGYHFRYPKDVSYYLLSLLQLCLSSLAKIVKKVYS